MNWKKPGKAYDVVVIGGGPAGLMAAYQAGMRGLTVAVVEKMDAPARKLCITGKGRCNVVNNTDVEGVLANVRAGGRFLYSSLSAFSSADVMRFFERQGVALKTERGSRVFPVSDRAQDIAQALVEAAERTGCHMVCARVTGIIVRDGTMCGVKLADQTAIEASAVVVATGGLSYPKTGSTGDGYRFAKNTGHTVIDLAPSLVPLECAGDICAGMQGLSLRNVALCARRDGKTVFAQQGELLFTHFGISGPLVLTLSAHLAGGAFPVDASIDWKPALDAQALDKRLLRDFAQNSNRVFRNSLGALLPQKAIPAMVALSGIEPDKKVNAVTARERAALARLIKAFPLTITGARPIAEAVVTAGGVALKEIHPRTMESKKVKNLHFAGEVLDADGYTGGFNLGIAFATGAAAGRHCLEGYHEGNRD